MSGKSLRPGIEKVWVLGRKSLGTGVLGRPLGNGTLKFSMRTPVFDNTATKY